MPAGKKFSLSEQLPVVQMLVLDWTKRAENISAEKPKLADSRVYPHYRGSKITTLNANPITLKFINSDLS